MTSSLVLKRVLQVILKLCYRYEVRGLEHMEGLSGRVLVVVNHVSLLDGALMMAAMNELPLFAIYTGMADRWWLRPFHKIANLFPLDQRNPLAVKALVSKVRTGRPCVIFPEGRLSVTGALMKVYGGPAYIADHTDATIVPVRIEGAELTPFSRLNRGQVRQRWFPKITITFVAPRKLDLDPGLRGAARRAAANRQLYEIMSDMVFRTTDWGATLFEALLRARGRHGRGFKALEDVSGTTLTYRRLVIGALALGRRLAEETAPGERVGLLLPNVNATAVAFMGLQAFGRVPAMLNFSTGTANMEAATQAAGLKLVATSRRMVEEAGLEEAVAAIGRHARILWLEDLRPEIGTGRKLRAFADSLWARRLHHGFGVGTDDPAVVLFTSGSEGRPKGVVLSHRNLLANCAQAAARVDFNELDRCFNALPIFHSFGLLGGTLLPLLGGVGTYLYPSPLHYRIVPEVIYDKQATILFGTNSFLKGYGRAADPYDFRSLRYVFAGAEPLQDDTSTTWFEKFGIRILSGYGATETAPLLSLNTPMHYKKRTVGRFMPGIEWRLEPVEGLERGGRLWVRGPNIMLGYLRYESLGVIDPPEDGWYDTGDIVEVDEAGFITIAGRAKRFAKLGGEMVSLGAVEDLVAGLAPEEGHAAIAVTDRRKGERIVLVTTAQGLERSRIAEAARAEGLGELLAPAEIVSVKELPLLGTGKTDYPAVRRLVEAKLEAAA